jgi:hypothetical protein
VSVSNATIPTIPAAVTTPPRRMAARREYERARRAAGHAPATPPIACAPFSAPIASSSNPSAR